MRLVKFTGADGTDIRGDVVDEAGKDLRVHNLNAKPGDRNLFWVPRSGCMPLTDAEITQLKEYSNDNQRTTDSL